jgi:hypothetical protein
MNSEYTRFDDGRPKFRLMWTNNTKHFYIDDKEVTEEVWIEAVKDDSHNQTGEG